MNNIIFIHTVLINGCKERLLQYLDLIYKSNLIDNIIYIYICFVGPHILSLHDLNICNYDNKIQIINVSPNASDYELPTLQYMYNYCLNNPKSNILYLHTKNIGKDINLCIEDQIDYMVYFLVTKWNICVEKLLKFDTCGVDLRMLPTIHYSGNFWWSTSKNIISLPSPNDFNNLNSYPNPLNSLRHNQEFWICYNKNIGNYYSLWDCGIDVYQRHLHRYAKELYIDC